MTQEYLPSRQHHWIKRFVSDFEYNPDFQIRFHFIAMRFWELNALCGTLLLLLEPRLWASIGVFYVFLLSIYANWDTDYDATSAAQASKHAQGAEDRLKGGT
jgi:hypothetical protein